MTIHLTYRNPEDLDKIGLIVLPAGLSMRNANHKYQRFLDGGNYLNFTEFCISQLGARKPTANEITEWEIWV